MPIQSLAHVCLKSTDLAATEKFYCATLGLTRLFRFLRQGKIIGFYMKTANDTFVEVFLADATDKMGAQVLNHFCLQTDSIAALRKTLLDHGYAPGEIKMGADKSPQFWMQDPNGLALEFQEYTPQSAQLTGRDVEVDW